MPLKPRRTNEQTRFARHLRAESPIPEHILWNVLRNSQVAGLRFRRQVSIGAYCVDFLCVSAKLVVELDGESHEGRQQHDAQRTAFLKKEGLRVLRITNDDVMSDVESVAIAIAREAGVDVQAWLNGQWNPPAQERLPPSMSTPEEPPHPNPLPRRRGRGDKAGTMKALSFFVLLLATVTGFASDSPPVETYQVLYLADSGVVVLRLSIVVDGAGPKQCHETFVDALLKNLDKNGDKVVAVDEARGKLLTAREAQQLQLVPADGATTDSSPDIGPKDGKISRSELLAYFKRIGLLPFSMKYQPRAAETAPNPNGMAVTNGETPLFEKLDVNADGKLSAEELANSLDVLRKLDRDNDETISVAELQPLAAQPVPRPGMNAVAAATNPFVSLASGESLPKMIRRIVDKYDSTDPAKSGVASSSTKNQRLSRLELGLPETEFVNYDVDGDGQLDFTELRQFVASADPTLELALNLATGKVESTGESGMVRATADGAIHLQFGGTQISFAAARSMGTPDLETLVKPLFTAVDADANGYLEKNEVPDSRLYGATFADLDPDKDGKVYLDEVIEYLKTRQDAARSRVELVIAEQGRTLFDILDSDRDGRLARREVRSVREKLTLWDADSDGQLAETEIPLQFRVIAVQGSLPNMGLFPQNLAMTPGGTAARSAGPVWFRKMDRNSDGEISRREFLGDLELFDALDLNRDGAVELSEALQAKAAK